MKKKMAMSSAKILTFPDGQHMVYICVFVFVYVCVRICVYICMHVYMRIFVETHISIGAVQKLYHAPEGGGGISRGRENSLFYLIFNRKTY